MEISDRRFNVAPRQESAIQLEHDDIVQIRSELAAFADYLHSYEVNHKNVKQVLLSEAREKLIKLSKTTVDNFFHAVVAGDLAYFTQHIDSGVKEAMEGIRYHDYILVVKRWIGSVGTETNVSRNELRMCYQFLQNTTISPTKFGRMCDKYGLDNKSIRIDSSNPTKGMGGVRWWLIDGESELLKEEANSNVIPLKEKL
jgi:hypothetical protein